MKPYYTDPLISIFNMDSREYLSQIEPDVRFDLVLSDPPYGTEGLLSNGYGRAQNCGTGRYILGDKDLTTCEDVIKLIMPRIDNGYLVTFCSARKMMEVSEFFTGGEIIGELIWDKGTPGLGYIVRYTHESALLCRKGSPKRPETALLSLVRQQVGHQNAHLRHPHEKPLTFWYNALNLPGELVIDPFAGSCNVGRACKDLGRKCICVELDEQWCEQGAKKMQQETLPTINHTQTEFA